MASGTSLPFPLPRARIPRYKNTHSIVPFENNMLRPRLFLSLTAVFPKAGATLEKKIKRTNKTCLPSKVLLAPLSRALADVPGDAARQLQFAWAKFIALRAGAARRGAAGRRLNAPSRFSAPSEARAHLRPTFAVRPRRRTRAGQVSARRTRAGAAAGDQRRAAVEGRVLPISVLVLFRPPRRPVRGVMKPAF